MSGIPADAFRGRRILVTGHTGFKGSWLALWLHRLGAQVTGYALAPPTQPSNFELARVRELLAAHHEADVRDFARVQAALNEADPEVVFHLAAQAVVRIGHVQPRETFDTNVMGTVNLLEAVRTRGRPCVVIVTTSDKCYENRGCPDGFRETDPLGGEEPYSASKAAAEFVTAAYRGAFFPAKSVGQHGIKLASVRAGNVIGGGDWAPDRIISDAVVHLAAGRPVPVRNPDAVRPWQHVLEPLGGYLALAARMRASDDACWCEAWNFGPPPGEDVTVGRLVDRCVEAWGSGSWQAAAGAAQQPAEVLNLRLRIDKTVRQLGWQPRWGLNETIRRTTAWYRRYYDDPGADMRQACLDDIAAYEQQRPTPRLAVERL